MAQVLETIIAINAKVGNGFSAVGAQLQQLGALVNGISQGLIDFGKDSVEVYKDYEKSMADAEVALSTIYGRNTSELSSVMSQLDTSATEWAASTIFHTNDVANAISEAAHAGWDLNQIMTGIPAAIKLAQAGSMDLSQAVDYIVKSTNAAGIEFDDIGSFIDHWSYAANSSATNIEELGDAMLRMGGTMKFADNTDELLTMLAVLADTGYVGESAGTLLRNGMMRLVAPTKKAQTAMSELGATSQEVAELMGNEELAAANARLEETGFSAYDTNGNLKSMLDTYRDLYVALGEVAGGYDKIMDNEESLAIMSSIFPQRSLPAALAFLDAVSQGSVKLYEDLQNGLAEGYGDYAAGIEMDTLYGKTETFESKVERLKQLVGEELAPDLEKAMSFAGGLVDSVAELDDGAFGAIVSGLEVVAAAGPGLVLAGSGMRFIGTIAGSTAAQIGIAAIAAVALVNSLDSLVETDFEDKFGELDLDQSAILDYVGGLKENFSNARAEIEELQKQLEEIETSYTNATKSLSNGLFKAAITGNKLTDSDISELTSYGTSIGDAVKAGIDTSFATVMDSVNAAFSGDGTTGAADNGAWSMIIAALSQDYEKSIGKAESLSKQLRDAMTSAFADKELTGEERANIQSLLNQIDDEFAKHLAIESAGEKARALHKIRTLGLGSYEEALEIMYSNLDGMMEDLEVEQAKAYESSRISLEEAAKTGGLWTNPATGETLPITPEDVPNALADLKAHQDERSAYYRSMNLPAMMELADALFTGSDLEGEFSALKTFAGSISRYGVSTPNARNAFTSQVDTFEAGELGRIINPLVEKMGGIDALNDTVEYLRSTGDQSDAELATQIESFSLATQALNQYATGVNLESSAYKKAGNENDSYNELQGYISNIGLSASQIAEFAGSGLLNLNAAPTIVGQMEASAAKYGYEGNELGIKAWIEDVIPPEDMEKVPVEGELKEISTENAPETAIPLAPTPDHGLAETETIARDVWNANTGERGISIEGLAELDAVDLQMAGILDQLESLSMDNLGIPDVQEYLSALTNPDYQWPIVPQMEEVKDAVLGESVEVPVKGEVEELNTDGISEEMTTVDVTANVSNAENELDIQTGVITPEVGDVTVTPEIDLSAIPTDIEPVQMTVEPIIEGDLSSQDAIQDVEGETVTVNVDGDTGQLQGAITENDGQQLTEIVNGDNANLYASIWELDGQTIITYVDGDTSSAQGAINALNGQTVYINVVAQSVSAPVGGYAEGGRADTPSIFGEAGPEWAIPEEHTENTRKLLAKAAEASGFSLLEIAGAAKEGAAPASSGSDEAKSMTIVYSPTINASNVDGVERALGDDKKAFIRYMKEKLMFDRMEVYA